MIVSQGIGGEEEMEKQSVGGAVRTHTTQEIKMSDRKMLGSLPLINTSKLLLYIERLSLKVVWTQQVGFSTTKAVKKNPHGVL